MIEEQVIQSLAALAHPVRLKAFRALVVAGPEGATPSWLATQLHVAPTALSFHLKELTHAELITQERVGRHLIYRAAYLHMNQVLSYLTDNCCQGQSYPPSSTNSCQP